MNKTKLIYIDDSGSVDTGVIVYAWIEVEFPHWNAALGRWLSFRKDLDRTDGIPTAHELHATKFIRGAGDPSRFPDWNRHKAHRARVARAALDTIASLPGTQVGAVHRHTDKPGAAYHAERADLYGQLVHHLDRRLGTAGDHGMIVMDGNGTDPTYRRQHRALKLTTRHIVEDPFFSGSDTNQPVQIADLLAYTAYHNVLRTPTKKFMWNWWPDHLPDAAPPTAM
ncbi:DUF3800 domain-containing protein (plasmid) [Embleya sp. NBC_00888]|uniref:DUF3800 domain-containing protein n=1 Tax=Embleya sp. NBC_00888 TaxID=2975960 RepID=UPI002F90E17B|nr:DUF3800 domain-containing protein [Embleya sp. NBC_00888]